MQETSQYSAIAGTATILVPGGQAASVVFYGISALAAGLEISLYSEHTFIDTVAELVKMALPVKEPFNLLTDELIDLVAYEAQDVIDIYTPADYGAGGDLIENTMGLDLDSDQRYYGYGDGK